MTMHDLTCDLLGLGETDCEVNEYPFLTGESNYIGSFFDNVWIVTWLLWPTSCADLSLDEETNRYDEGLRPQKIKHTQHNNN